jgi:hypothetical protein
MIIQVKEFQDKKPTLLYKEIKKDLDQGMRIVLDFKFVPSLAYEFLIDSVGQVLSEYDFESIKHKLNFINVDVEIKEMLLKIVNDATN